MQNPYNAPGSRSIKKIKSGRSFLFKSFVVLFLIVCGFLYLNENSALKDYTIQRLRALEQENARITAQSLEKDEKLKIVQKEKEEHMEKIKEHEINVQKLLKEKEEAGEQGFDHEGEKAKMKVESLMNEIQRHAKHDVETQFGAGPHQVLVELDFPGGSPGPEDATEFVIEMAPLDLMPHSVHLFLEQVTHDLWTGGSFHRNAGHVIQAGPVPYFRNQGNPVRKGFNENHLTSVAFQEYNEKYPHVKYTVGFAGRPGGPDWYVSTVDNTRNHGPGGQTGYKKKEEADPCFGRVIKGFDTVDRVHKMKVKPGWYNAMEENVGFKKVRLLKPEEHVSVET